VSTQIDPAATPPAPGVSAWNIANAFTLLRLGLVPIFGVLLLHGSGEELSWRIAAAVVFAVAVITDRVDGELARRRGLVTDVGKIADPIADKALIGTALVGLSLLGELPWWITVVILVREVGVTLLRFLVIRHGVMPAGRGGKAKTAIQALAIGLFILPLDGAWHAAAVAVMGAAIAVTVVTGADYAVKAYRLRQTSELTARRRAARRRACAPGAADGGTRGAGRTEAVDRSSS
jgi:CDP-diacylglycerol--glycerol-3-phosphate 3-phosphatidyltransferase